jgi:hemerythrin superfamily protein
MDVVQLIKREHTKTSGLFDKLVDTSDNALKTRERLFDELKFCLEAHNQVVQSVVYPILLQNPETRDLVPELREQNERSRMIDELEQTPKDDEDFLAKLKGLRKIVEQHLRAEERQVFPAIKKVVGDDEAQELAKRIAAELREETQEAQARAEDTASAPGRAAAAATSAIAAGPLQLANVAAQVLQATETLFQTSRQTADDLQAFMAAPAATARVAQEVQKVWIDYFGRTAAMNARGAQELSRCSNMQQLAELQGRLIRNNLNGWLEGTAETLRIAGRVSSDALHQIEDRVGHTAEEPALTARSRKSEH